VREKGPVHELARVSGGGERATVGAARAGSSAAGARQLPRMVERCRAEGGGRGLGTAPLCRGPCVEALPRTPPVTPPSTHILAGGEGRTGRAARRRLPRGRRVRPLAITRVAPAAGRAARDIPSACCVGSHGCPRGRWDQAPPEAPTAPPRGAPAQVFACPLRGWRRRRGGAVHKTVGAR